VSVDLIPYAVFGRLRLADFVSAKLEERAGWEYMDDLWVGEGLGFTEFLRLAEDPEVVRSIALDLADLPPASSAAVLGAIGLPLAPGVPAEEVTARLGTPDSVERYVGDRVTYCFTCGSVDQYAVTCTVHETAGLIYVTVLTPTPRRLAVEEDAGEA
jgi:hypothetical protein